MNIIKLDISKEVVRTPEIEETIWDATPIEGKKAYLLQKVDGSNKMYYINEADLEIMQDLLGITVRQDNDTISDMVETRMQMELESRRAFEEDVKKRYAGPSEDTSYFEWMDSWIKEFEYQHPKYQGIAKKIKKWMQQ